MPNDKTISPVAAGLQKEQHAIQQPMLDEFNLNQHASTFNDGTKVKQLIHEEYNTGRNIGRLLELIESGGARDISFEKKVDNTPFFLVSSGPSFDKNIHHLRDWHGGIFCSTSHALTLMYHGIEPTHIIALDPFCEWKELEGVDWSKTRTKLCLQPGVWPDLVENWPNDILLFRQDSAQANSFYATTQLHMFTKRTGTRQEWTFDVLIPTSVTLFACSPPAQLFIAAKLGYGICFLIGADFAYFDGKIRFTTYTVKKPAGIVQAGNAPPVEVPAEWEEHVDPLVELPENVRDQDKLCMSENGMLTSQVNIFYKKNFISAWRLSRKMIYTTDHGAITEAPYMFIGKVIRTQGDVPVRTERWILNTTERYLARHNAFVVETEKGGHQFIETQNPEVDVPQFLTKMRQQCICPTCGLQAVNETDKEPDSETCPRCEQAQFERKHDIDVVKNLTRLHTLLEWVRENKKPRPVPV
jgi:hypothetical protein